MGHVTTRKCWDDRFCRWMALHHVIRNLWADWRLEHVGAQAGGCRKGMTQAQQLSRDSNPWSWLIMGMGANFEIRQWQPPEILISTCFAPFAGAYGTLGRGIFERGQVFSASGPPFQLMMFKFQSVDIEGHVSHVESMCSKAAPYLNLCMPKKRKEKPKVVLGRWWNWLLASTGLHGGW